MKKFLLLLFAFMVTISGDLFAQTYKYYTTDFAYKEKDDYGYWSDWTDWQDSHCLVTINTNKEIVTIYSKTPQEFDIVEDLGESYDDSGLSNTWLAVDDEGLRCHLRLRHQDNGILQLYIEYNDLVFVYCLTER